MNNSWRRVSRQQQCHQHNGQPSTQNSGMRDHQAMSTPARQAGFANSHDGHAENKPSCSFFPCLKALSPLNRTSHTCSQVRLKTCSASFGTCLFLVQTSFPKDWENNLISGPKLMLAPDKIGMHTRPFCLRRKRIWDPNRKMLETQHEAEDIFVKQKNMKSYLFSSLTHLPKYVKL